MTASAEVAKESSNQVIALVLATLFAGAAVAGVALLLLIAFLTWNHLEGQGSADDDDKKAHVRDTGVAPVIDIAKPVRRGGGANADADGDADGGVAMPVTTGPITIQIPKDRFFHSLEINCPDAGIRRRATFRRHRASTSGVPIAEECMVTFQGSEPAKTTIRGGQRKRCESFNPTRCVLY